MRAKLLSGVCAVALAGGFLPVAPAQADPSGGTIVQASDALANSIDTTPGAFVITQGSDRIAINWEGFSISNGESVTFNQPGNQSIALNRVIGSGGPIPQSVIDGMLLANGHVWLLNPSGIAFGANASVDVGGLLATSADMDPATFIGLDPTTDTFAFTGGSGAVTNAGDLDAQGLMALVAPVVTNSGDLTSSHGDVLLGGAEAYRLRFVSTARDSGAFNELLVTDFIIDTGSSSVGAGGDMVHQTSTGNSVGGRIIANASRLGGGAFLNMEGLVEAQDVGALSGDVFLLGGTDITAGALGTTATDAVKTDNMTIIAPGTATAQGTAVTIGTGAGPGTSATANVALTATTGDISAPGDFDATAGTLTFSAVNGSIDAGDLSATGAITLTAQDIDFVGTNRTVNSSGGAVSLTATGSGANNISSTGVLDIDGDSVTLSGATTATIIDIDADNGGVTANTVTASAGSASIDATGAIDVDDVSGTTTVRVVSSGDAVDVGNLTGPGGITVTGTDIDLTGTGGSVQSTGGAIALTANGGVGNDISATGALDIDGDSVSLSGPVAATAIDIDADNGGVTAGSVTASAGSASIDATGAIDVDDVSGTTTVRVVSSGDAVDVGNLTGPGGITVTGTDIDLTGTGGSVQSTGGAIALTANGGVGNDISATGALDIDGDSVSLSGPVAATAIDIDADNGGVTAGSVTASAGSASIDATGAIDVDDVSGTTTVRVVSSGDAVDVGNLTGPGGITVTGTDIDLTGTGGSVQSTGGAIALTANGGVGNDISATGALDIDGDSVSLSGPVAATAIDIDADNGGVTAGSVTASAGSASIDATGAIDVDDVSGTTTVRVVSSGDAVDVGNLTGPGGITVTGTDIDLTGTGGSVQSTGGAIALTANGGVGNDISATGALDIDGDSVSLSGPVAATAIDIDANNGGVTAGSVTASAGSVSIDATGNVDVDDVSATTTVRVVSGTGAVDVGDVVGPTGVTISGTDVDLTGTNGSVQSTGGAVAIAASGGGANNISSAGAIDVDGTSVSLTGNLTATGNAAITASTGNATTTGSLTSTGGFVSMIANAGNVVVQAVQAATGVTLSGQDIDLTGAINGGTGTASLTATAGDISTGGLLDIDAGAIVLTGPVNATTGIDLDAGTAGIMATNGTLTTTGGVIDISAPSGTIYLESASSPGNLTLRGAAVTFIGNLVAQGQIALEALTGSVTGTGTSSITGPNAGLTARAVGGTVTLNDVNIGNSMSAVGGAVALTGTSTVGGTATLQALTGNVHVAGGLNALGGILLIEAPGGAAIINDIASSSDVSLEVLDLDLTGTISAGDQFNLTPAGSGRTIVLGGSGGSDGLVFRLPQGFTLDGSEITRISAKKLQFNAGNNDLALLSATFNPTVLQSLEVGASSSNWIMAGGDIRGIPSLQLGYVEGGTSARPELIFVSGSLGEDTAAGRLDSLRLESAGDIIIGTQAFFDAYRAANGNLDLATLGEPDLGQFQGTRGHVFIAVDQLRLVSPEEIVQLNTGTGSEGAGVVFSEATAGEATIEAVNGGPTRVNLFGTVINSAGQRVTGFDAGLEPNLLDTAVTQNGELRLNLCVIGNSASCSIAILREAQESARSRNSALSSLTNSAIFGFDSDKFDDDEDEEDLGGVAGAGNESLWGIGLP